MSLNKKWKRKENTNKRKGMQSIDQKGPSAIHAGPVHGQSKQNSKWKERGTQARGFLARRPPFTNYGEAKCPTTRVGIRITPMIVRAFVIKLSSCPGLLSSLIDSLKASTRALSLAWEIISIISSLRKETEILLQLLETARLRRVSSSSSSLPPEDPPSDNFPGFRIVV